MNGTLSISIQPVAGDGSVLDEHCSMKIFLLGFHFQRQSSKFKCHRVGESTFLSKLPSRDISTLTIMMAMKGLVTPRCSSPAKICHITFLLVRKKEEERECSSDASFSMASFSKPMPGKENEQHPFRRYSVVKYYVSGCVLFAVWFIPAEEFSQCNASNGS